jgi:transcriptional regulator with XRE-family HTH domain
VADRRTPLGEIIRRQRELNAVSMRHFADMVGISNPYMSQIERGLREPSEKVLDAIAQNLDLSVDALYDAAGMDDAGDEGEESAVREAIREDPRLNARQRQALLEVYDAFAGPPAPRRRRRRAKGGDADQDAASPLGGRLTELERRAAAAPGGDVGGRSASRLHANRG